MAKKQPSNHRCSKLSVREKQQNYKGMCGNPDNRPEKIILPKKLSFKKPHLIAIVGRFLPVCFFYRFNAN